MLSVSRPAARQFRRATSCNIRVEEHAPFGWLFPPCRRQFQFENGQTQGWHVMQPSTHTVVSRTHVRSSDQAWALSRGTLRQLWMAKNLAWWGPMIVPTAGEGAEGHLLILLLRLCLAQRLLLLQPLELPSRQLWDGVVAPARLRRDREGGRCSQQSLRANRRGWHVEFYGRASDDPLPHHLPLPTVVCACSSLRVCHPTPPLPILPTCQLTTTTPHTPRSCAVPCAAASSAPFLIPSTVVRGPPTPHPPSSAQLH